MRRLWKGIAALLCAVCLTAFPAAAEETAEGADNPAIEMTVTLGYDNQITYGKTIPVRVTIVNLGTDFEGMLGVNASVNKKQYDRYETEVNVPSGMEKTYTLPIKVYTKQDQFTAELTRDGQVEETVTVTPAGTINPNAMLIGVLSTRPKQLAYLDLNRENDPLHRYDFMQTVALDADTLPEDDTLLQSFGMIVLDDLDPASLSEGQRNALRRWILSDGKVLLVSGGAQAGRNLAFTGDLTGLTLEKTVTGGSVVPALEEAVGTALSGEDPQVLLAVMNGDGAVARDEAGNGVLFRTVTEGGRVYTAAFDLADPALAGTKLIRSLWQQVILKYDSNQYTTMLYNTGSNNEATVFPGYAMLVNAKGPVLPAALTAAGAMILGCVLWAMLRKKGKQQWLWLILPLIALAAGGAVALMSMGSQLKEPMACTGVNVLQSETGGMRRFGGIYAAMPEYGFHTFGVKDGDVTVRMWDYSDYYEDDEDKEARMPVQQRNCYRIGEHRSVGLNLTAPWEMNALVCEDTLADTGRIEAGVWMENDGLHATIRNSTEWRMEQGVLLTPYGWAEVPALSPGESADVTMLKAEMKDPQNPVYEKGYMYTNVQADSYTLVNAATAYDPVRDTYQSPESEVRSTLMSAAVNQMQSEQRVRSGSKIYTSVAPFVYQAETKDMPSMTVIADGKEIRRISSAVMLSAAAEWLQVGPTGVVFHPAGQDQPVRCEVDENLMPDGEMDTSQVYGYATLSENPTFRFSPAGVKNMEITALTVNVESYYENLAKAYVLDPQTRTWEEIKINSPVETPERWLDDEGNLYVQFRSLTGDDYNDISMPMITLEGRVRNAAD